MTRDKSALGRHTHSHNNPEPSDRDNENRPRTIFIIGAGIAGLTLALALAKFGARIVVFERASSIETEGAGIQLSPNARTILDQLGLKKALDLAALQPQAIDVYPFRRPMPLKSLNLGDLAHNRFGARYDVIHRGDLLDALHKACRRFANIDIRLGVRDFDIEWHARGVSFLADDPNHETRTQRPFAIIGADGVHSKTRTEHLQGPKARYSGMVAWRTLLPMNAENLPFASDRTSLLWGPGFHAVLYPLPARKQINVALFTKQKLTAIERGTLEKDPQLPKNLYQSPHFRALIEAADNGWTYWPLYSVTSTVWHRGPVGLIGDAAHAMLPFQAQGAAMAIEDAAILAPLLMTDQSAEQALNRYHALRKSRVAKVTSISKRNGFAFHLEWPFTIPRDLVIASQNADTHFERLAWIYDYKAVPEIAVAPQNRTTEAKS